MESRVIQITNEKHVDRLGEAHDLARIYQRIQIQHILVQKCCMDSSVIQIIHEMSNECIGKAHDLARKNE